MEYLYHCSPTPGLTVLEPGTTRYFGKPKQVCLTASLPMALMYAVRHFEYTYGYTGEGAIYYAEYFPGALEELYAGKSATLYRCVRRADMTTTEIPNEYVTPRPVPVVDAVPVPDALEALLEQERWGALRIIRWQSMPEEARQWVERAEMDTILEHGLLNLDNDFARYMREKYPHSWALAQRSEEGDNKL